MLILSDFIGRYFWPVSPKTPIRTSQRSYFLLTIPNTKNFSCICSFFANATLLKAVLGFQYILNLNIINVAGSCSVDADADARRLSFADADPKFLDPHIPIRCSRTVLF